MNNLKFPEKSVTPLEKLKIPLRKPQPHEKILITLGTSQPLSQKNLITLKNFKFPAIFSPPEKSLAPPKKMNLLKIPQHP